MSTHLEAQKHLAQHDPFLKKIIQERGDCTITAHTDYYKELVEAIVSQQLSVKAAATIFKRLLDLFSGDMPTPTQIIDTATETLRATGCSFAKVSYMKDLAQHIDDGRLDLDHIAMLPNSEVITQLTAVKGIGEWSAHMFMIFSLGRLDVLPTGDLGIKKGVMKIYNLPTLPTPDDITDIAKKNNWHPYQSIACWYVWKSLDPV